MPRQKKSKQVEIDLKKEVNMTENELENENLQSENQIENENLEAVQTEIDLARQELENLNKEIKEIKLNSSRYIDENEQKIIDRQIARTKRRSGKIERQREYDSAHVTGKFINRRAPGQTAILTYIKYENDPVKWYYFKDGSVYTIPRGFADQINEYYYTPHFTQKQGEMDPNRPSSVIHEVDTSNKKYAFVPIEF